MQYASISTVKVEFYLPHSTLRQTIWNMVYLDYTDYEYMLDVGWTRKVLGRRWHSYHWFYTDTGLVVRKEI
jgi:hypothetical protein